MASKWSLDLLNKACTAVEEEKSRALAEQDPKLVLEEFLQKVMDEPREEDPVHDAYRIYYGIACIAMLADSSASSQTIVPKLERIIKSLLLRNKVKPRKSQLGHVYRQVAEVLGYYYCQKGDLDAAMWEVSIGHTLAQGSSQKPGEISQFTYAHLALNNGSAMLSCSLFRQIKEGTQSKFWYQAALVGEIKSLRLAGHRATIPVLLKELNTLELNERVKEHALWENMMHDMPEDLDAWILAQDEDNMRPSLAVRLALWLYAQSNPTAHLDTIKKLRKHRSFFKRLVLDQKTKVAVRAWEMIDSLYDSSVPFEVRLRQASTVMEMISKMYIDARCMTLVALHRWVMRNSQSHLSLLVEEEYRSLSLRLSQGMQSDVLNLMENVAKGRRILQDIFPLVYTLSAPSPSINRTVGLQAELVQAGDEIHVNDLFNLSLGA
ncbi:MAG TPA: hypothetical protein VE954_22830 [Oligoflexus sp.]|uniref:hypothetical protein n=1 Tax=Oligoflexus sp. TaxID=1971216 RepID=UPI002D5670E1|nr:hypothetical protein [Oligoflexus sp.]HYX35946.1 hypothetical protein [Oligoflexus sp.]